MRLRQESIKNICHTAIIKSWNTASRQFPAFLVPVTPSEQQGNEAWLDSIQQEADRIGRNRKKGQALLQRFLLEEPVLGVRALGQETLQSFLEEMKRFQKGCREFDADISQEALFQAFRNYSVYAVFLILNGMPQHCHQAILAYSLLYPYTDNVLDDPGFSTHQKKSLNDLIYARLTGETAMPAPVSLQEEQVDRLLRMVEEYYPYSTHQTLYDSLLLIYDAQLDSLRQQNPAHRPSTGEILALSVYKGSTSVLADRCLMPLELSEAELPFYLGLGFFLQLCDDLQDIEEDLQNGSCTLFTSVSGKEERSLLVNRMFHYLEILFQENSSLFDGQKEAVSFLQKNCHTLIISTVLSVPQYFCKNYVTKLEQYFPVTGAYLDRQSRYIRNTLLPMILSISDHANPFL